MAKRKYKHIRSIEYQIRYYKTKTMEQKLKDTVELSEFCINLAKAANKVGFSGK